MAYRGVIVTGGFGALGSAVANAFAKLGDRVARVDFAMTAPPALENGLDLGGIDLTDQTAGQKVVESVLEAFGRIDTLVNIAGGFVWETLDGGDIASWQRMFAMNVITAAGISKAAVPALMLNPDAAIINVGAGAAIHSDAGMGAYAAAKSGVHRLTESLAKELAKTSIRTNAILPSIIDTPSNRADMPGADPSEWVHPNAIADVIVFLASPAARAINGALIPVSHGQGRQA